VFDWNNKQNGILIGSIGIISAFVQGGYVRRTTSKVGEGVMARRGVSSCVIGLALLAILPQLVSSNPTVAIRLLQGAAVFMAFTSATVVNSLTAFASLQCDDGGFDSETGKPMQQHPRLAKGRALGEFRSSGQLGRAIGPLLGMSHFSNVSEVSCSLFNSLRIILDIRAKLHIFDFRACHVRVVCQHEVDSHY
jgi:hypothetical protein